MILRPANQIEKGMVIRPFPDNSTWVVDNLECWVVEANPHPDQRIIAKLLSNDDAHARTEIMLLPNDLVEIVWITALQRVRPQPEPTAVPVKPPFRFHQLEHPLDRLPFTPGYSPQRRCSVCGRDEYTLSQSSECPGPPVA